MAGRSIKDVGIVRTAKKRLLSPSEELYAWFSKRARIYISEIESGGRGRRRRSGGRGRRKGSGRRGRRKTSGGHKKASRGKKGPPRQRRFRGRKKLGPKFLRRRRIRHKQKRKGGRSGRI